MRGHNPPSPGIIEEVLALVNPLFFFFIIKTLLSPPDKSTHLHLHAHIYSEMKFLSSIIRKRSSTSSSHESTYV